MVPNVVNLPIRTVEGGSVSECDDALAAEEPLEILLGERNVSITMRTPCNDEELAAGFLFTEGILRDRSQIAGIAITGENQVTVSLTGHTGVDLGRLERHFYMSSSCGVCGATPPFRRWKPLVAQVSLLIGQMVHPDLIHRLPELL